MQFCLSLHYNKRSSSLYDITTKTYEFKAKYTEIRRHFLCLGNTSKHFAYDKMKKITGLRVYVYTFCVDYTM